MIAVTAASAVIGCGGAGTAPARPEEARIAHLPSGREVSFEEMVEDLARARAVYVGESHDDPRHHAAEVALVRALHARDPSLAVGVEMVQRPFQEALDAWASGALDESAFLERVEWETRWGYDFALYRDLFELCRRERIPMVALNARKELTRAIARRGIEGLDEALRAELPELVLDDPAHRAMVRGALEGHPGLTDAFFERMYAAQVTWDETMAASAVEALARPDAPDRIVVIAGAFHVDRGLGIPKRAARRGLTPYRVVTLVSETDGARADHREPHHYRWASSARRTTP